MIRNLIETISRTARKSPGQLQQLTAMSDFPFLLGREKCFSEFSTVLFEGSGHEEHPLHSPKLLDYMGIANSSLFPEHWHWPASASLQTQPRLAIENKPVLLPGEGFFFAISHCQRCVGRDERDREVGFYICDHHSHSLLVWFHWCGFPKCTHTQSLI